MEKIRSIKAREILDSRGLPTIEAKLKLSSGIEVFAQVPSGTSTGKREALELRDGGEQFFGMGVKKAVKNINEKINKAIKGKIVSRQKEIDELLIELDGTENKSFLGANAILATSIAVCRGGARAKKMPLWKYINYLFKKISTNKKIKPKIPKPCLLLIEGGLHSGCGLDFQEFMIVPSKESFKENLEEGVKIYYSLKEILERKYGKIATNVGLEGAFAPPIEKAEKALDLIVWASKNKKIKIIIDAAASHFYKKSFYEVENSIFTSHGLLKFYLELCQIYPILGIEDPFSEEDWEGFSSLLKEKNDIFVIGDDLLVSNLKLIKKAEKRKACNGVVLKVNQIGTVWEALEAASFAQSRGWQVFVKHRSGETCDDFIADLSVGIGCGWIMSGAPTRGERVAKYNRILEIEEEEFKRYKLL